METTNRVAVISGATGGLGREVAQRMAGNGFRLALLGRNMESLDRLATELPPPRENYLKILADLNTSEGALDASQSVWDHYGRSDILIHLVGGWTGGKSIGEVPVSDVENMLQQHLWTSFFITRAFLPRMIENHWGRIIMISSPFATKPNANGGPYAIGKAAQEALMLTLAQEFKGNGVTANLLLVKTIDVNYEREQQLNPKNSSWTTPEEISATIQFLCSEEASTINGARIPLFGSGY